jgi:hypothetical protein
MQHILSWESVITLCSVVLCCIILNSCEPIHIIRLIHVLNYSNCKCAIWVFQTFLRPSLVPKCDTYYLKNKCCYTYSNSKLVTLSHTHVTCFHLSIQKLSHALIKHKDFINYILPSASHLPKYIDLSQLNSSIHSSQFRNYYHISLIITSQYKTKSLNQLFSIV